LSVLFDKTPEEIQKNNNLSPIKDTLSKGFSSGIYVPKETKRSPININFTNSKSPNLLSSPGVFSVLKHCASESNQPDLLYLIDFLKNKLNGEDVNTIKDEEKLKIKLPFCWNCKVNTCKNHKKEI